MEMTMDSKHTIFRKQIRRIAKAAIVLIIITLWLRWDLTQAFEHRTTIYKTFELTSDKAAAVTTPTTVSIVRSDDAALANPCSTTSEAIDSTTITQMVKRAVDLAGGLSSIIKSGDTVLIKPNLVQQDSSGSGGVTDVRVVKALVYLIDSIDHGKIKIIVGDGSARPFTTFEKATGTTATAWTALFDVPGYQTLKTRALADGIDFRLSNLNGNSDTNPWPELDSTAVPGGGSATPQGGHYFIHQDVTHATVYIPVPVLKVHEQPGFTCALKDQIGLAAGSRYGFSKTSGVKQESKFHKLLHSANMPYNWQDKEIVDLSAIAKIKFVVVDAINCLQIKKTPDYTNGYINVNIPNRVKMNMVIAGRDPVAVDHVCARLIGLNPDDIEHITLAERKGLGTNDSAMINVVGSTIAASQKIFKKPLTPNGNYGQGNRDWIVKGPYRITGISDPINYEFISGESTLMPVPGLDSWSASTYFINDRINLGDYFSLGSPVSSSADSCKVVSYAATYFKAPRTQQAELWIGNDEALKIYLNDSCVYTYNSRRTNFTDTSYVSEIIKVPIVQGCNKLIVKSLQQVSGNYYDFSINICDVDTNRYYHGNRIMGLKFASDPTYVGVPAAAQTQPKAFALQNCYPNPFNNAVQIQFTLNKQQPVSLYVYNMLGQLVKTVLRSEVRAASTYTETWNGTNDRGGVAASGTYFVVLRNADKQMSVRKILFLK
jgi:uncharacterized protein (DUF362 family)